MPTARIAKKRISELALLKRVNRRLVGRCETVIVTRGGSPRYFHLNTFEHSESQRGEFSDLEAFAREIGAILPHESLAI